MLRCTDTISPATRRFISPGSPLFPWWMRPHSDGPAGGRVLTGGWGCGYFRGDPQLKAIIQWLAASSCNRQMVYGTWGDERVVGLGPLVEAVTAAGVTVGRMREALLAALPAAAAGEGLLDALRAQLGL
jgi:hypothetical protein